MTTPFVGRVEKEKSQSRERGSVVGSSVAMATAQSMSACQFSHDRNGLQVWGAAARFFVAQSLTYRKINCFGHVDVL